MMPEPDFLVSPLEPLEPNSATFFFGFSACVFCFPIEICHIAGVGKTHYRSHERRVCDSQFGYRFGAHAGRIAKLNIAIPKQSPSTTRIEKSLCTATESFNGMPWKMGYTSLQSTM